MNYKFGLILQAFDSIGSRKVSMFKYEEGYKVIKFKKSGGVWINTIEQKAKMKKYAERHFINFITDL